MLRHKTLTPSIDLVWSDRPSQWKCNGLIVRSDASTVLIDCNFTGDEITELSLKSGNRRTSYFVSHIHLDHVNNLHNWEGRGVSVWCPLPEEGFIIDFMNLLDASGSTQFGTNDMMKRFAFGKLGFRELSEVSAFTPGTTHTFGNITLETLSLPGHSPGHTAFIISSDGTPREKSVLFASDIGLNDFGPWYGFKYCDIQQYRESVEAIKKVYAGGDFILASSHNEPFFEKQDPSIFDAIPAKMKGTEELLLKKISEKGPVALKELVLRGIYYDPAALEKMNDGMKTLYGFWEYHILNNLVKDCARRGLISVNSDGTVEQ